MYPEKKVIKYTSVKRDIYNPEMSSFRRIELDNQLGKLSDEHCRNVLPPTLGVMKLLFSLSEYFILHTLILFVFSILKQSLIYLYIYTRKLSSRDWI